MGCTSAKFDQDDGYFRCEVTGDACFYIRPNSKACAEEWGEGPDAYAEEDDEYDA